jgi:outer membrane protein OmpA-like peptidoglycan-associated protein
LLTLGAVAFAAMAVGCRHRPSGDVTSGGVRIRQLPNGTQITGDESLLFETGKAVVKPEGQVFLNKLARVLRDKPQATVLVEGHTDSVGSAPMNQGLSEKRALSVRQALIDRGVPASRISARGLGMTQPVGDNSTPEGRASNRRTEIFVSGDTIDSLD